MWHHASPSGGNRPILALGSEVYFLISQVVLWGMSIAV